MIVTSWHRYKSSSSNAGLQYMSKDMFCTASLHEHFIQSLSKYRGIKYEDVPPYFSFFFGVIPSWITVPCLQEIKFASFICEDSNKNKIVCTWQ